MKHTQNHSPRSVCNKVDMPHLSTTIIKTPIFEWYVVMCGSKNWHQKRHVFKTYWSVCSIHGNHSKLNSQHDQAEDFHFDNE